MTSNFGFSRIEKAIHNEKRAIMKSFKWTIMKMGSNEKRAIMKSESWQK
jgi:hypothetical protein